MIVTCTGCNTSFNLEDERVKKTGSKVRCSKCKNIFVAYQSVIVEEQDRAENVEKQESEVPQVKAEGLSLSDSEELSFSEVDGAIRKEEPELEEIKESHKEELPVPEEEELDFSDFSESLEKGEVPSTDILADAGGEKLELSDSENIDFSELEKMLENGEINFDNLLSEDNGGKLKFSDTEEIDLSELDAAIDNFEETDIDEIEEDTKELRFDFDNDQDSQILEIKDAEKLDFSDLETMLDSEEISDSTEKNKITGNITSDFDLELEPKSVRHKSEEEPDELDFSDLEKMLETETGAEESVIKPAEETAELSLEIDRTSAGRQGGLKFEDTIAWEEEEFDFQSDEAETEDTRKHMEKYEINKFQDTVAIEEKKINVAAIQEAEKDKIESGKVTPPPIRKNFFVKFLLIFGSIAVLLLGAGAFIYYNPFGLEIPFVSEYTESKADKSGNLKITPILYSLKGDFVDTTSGALFIITGMVRNDYKHPRTNVKVTGKLFAKGKALSKAESVFCGNVISEQDLLELEPAVMKKRLQNRLGDKNSNMSVKPGSAIPFMVIFENPSPDLDEFIIEADSSIKG